MLKSETRKRSSQKIFGRTGLQLRGIKACRPGFCSSREEELITDHEDRENETSFARWEFQSPKPNSILEKKISSLGLFLIFEGCFQANLACVFYKSEKTAGNNSQANLTARQVWDNVVGITYQGCIFTPSRTLKGFSLLSFYSATGQDNILRNNKLTKHWVMKIDSVWQGIKSTCSKQRKQTLKGDVELQITGNSVGPEANVRVGNIPSSNV